MSWDRFKRIMFRLNLGLVVLSGLFVVGVSAATGDWPKLDGLAVFFLMTLCALFLVSAFCFFACHSWLFVKAKLKRDLPRFDKVERRGFLLLIAGIVVTALLVIATESSPGAVPGGVQVIMGILAILALIYGGILSAMGFGSQYFRWFFTRSDYGLPEGGEPTT